MIKRILLIVVVTLLIVGGFYGGMRYQLYQFAGSVTEQEKVKFYESMYSSHDEYQRIASERKDELEKAVVDYNKGDQQNPTTQRELLKAVNSYNAIAMAYNASLFQWGNLGSGAICPIYIVQWDVKDERGKAVLVDVIRYPYPLVQKLYKDVLFDPVD